jgi:hypothetical protein
MATTPVRGCERCGEQVIDSPLPPSRFGAGYTAGAPTVPPPPSGRAQAHAGFGSIGQGQPHGPAGSGPRPAAVDGLAATSLALVLLLGPFVAPFTLPMSLAARARITRGGNGGGGLAAAALTLSCLYLVVAVVIVALIVVAGPGATPWPV